MAVSLALIAALAALALMTVALAARRERAVEVGYPPVGQIIKVNGARLHVMPCARNWSPSRPATPALTCPSN